MDRSGWRAGLCGVDQPGMANTLQISDELRCFAVLFQNPYADGHVRSQKACHHAADSIITANAITDTKDHPSRHAGAWPRHPCLSCRKEVVDGGPAPAMTDRNQSATHHFQLQEMRRAGNARIVVAHRLFATDAERLLRHVQPTADERLQV